MTKTNYIPDSQYLVIGSNNFWYGTCGTVEQARQVAHMAITGASSFGDDESNREQTQAPNTVYIYRAEEVERIKNWIDDTIQ